MEKKITFTAFFLFMTLFLTMAIDTTEGKVKDEMMNPARQVKLETAKGVFKEVNQRKSAQYKEGLAAYILNVNGGVSAEDAEMMAEAALEYGEKYEVDEKLIMAIAHTESTYYADAVSCADYKGLMQTGDHLAAEAGCSPEELFEPEVSIAVGSQYIGEQMENFDDDVRLALTAYNQGPGSVYAGDYSTDYADLTISRAEGIERFLEEEGYLQ